jgi:hypothetical protein
VASRRGSFTRWIDERKPERSTVESWRYVFQALAEHFQDRTAASIMPEEASEWVKGLVTRERSAATVKRTWLNAANTVFRWALDHKHIWRNPFAGIKVTVPRKGTYGRHALSIHTKPAPFSRRRPQSPTRIRRTKDVSGGCRGSVRTLAHAQVK